MKLSMKTSITNPINPRTNSPIPHMIEVCLNSCGVGFRAIRIILAQLPREILRNCASIASCLSWTLSSKERVWSFSSDMVSPQGVKATYDPHLISTVLTSRKNRVVQSTLVSRKTHGGQGPISGSRCFQRC